MANSKNEPGIQTCLVWENFGPYHYARLNALAELMDDSVTGVQIGDASAVYTWTCPEGTAVVSLLPGGVVEHISAWSVFCRFREFLIQHRIEVALLPSYWPTRSLALLLAGWSAGVRLVMMNESHAGTAQASGWKRWGKQQLLRFFDAALVGGAPHRRHFIAEGMPPETIFIGYDAVDNRYFADRSDACRQTGRPRGLPRRYVLNLGRFVAKKNLSVLIQAYAAAFAGSVHPPSLVMVGSGEEQTRLVELAIQIGLEVVDAKKIDPRQGSLEERAGPAVYFYGFRQIQENPLFYTFADVFVLPSLYEEWGLVVNEAMACGLPVIVSRTAGCAEDLVTDGENGFTFDPENVADLTTALTGVTANAELRERMGQRSREIIAGWGCDHFARQALKAVNAARVVTTVL